jgi:hypothetical protein
VYHARGVREKRERPRPFRTEALIHSLHSPTGSP